MNVLVFRMPWILVYVTWNQNSFQWALVQLRRKESSVNSSCFGKYVEPLPDFTININNDVKLRNTMMIPNTLGKHLSVWYSEILEKLRQDHHIF